MATRLDKPLVRELVLDNIPFKLIISLDGIRIMPKGKRKASIVTWETILQLDQTSREDSPAAAAADTDTPHSIIGDVATEIAAARSALTRAVTALTTEKTLPAELRRRLTSDPVYGDTEERADWFIEPLLTPSEVASVLRVSTAAVARLAIRSVTIAGERRYRQSEVRRFIEGSEENNTTRRW